MITDKGIVPVTQGVEYVNDWRDNFGGYELDKVIMRGKVIINKVVTGCGFTTYSLSNGINTILASPRLRLIQNKVEQFNKIEQQCFYFNREKGYTGVQKSIEQLKTEFALYYKECRDNNRPLKLLVTYDSFCNLADMLESFGINISEEFNITVDESHCLVKDIRLKEYCNKSVLSNFIRRLFTYRNVTFISATPIIDYLQWIDEFRNEYVEYYELQWDNVGQVITRTYNCNSALDAFNQVYGNYLNSTDDEGRHIFDAIYNGDGTAYYSREAVVFLNSVKEIRSILRKYVGDRSISPNDVTVICADNKENLKALHSVDRRLKITTSIPKKNELHTTWTFVTRTAFEGVDFYSPSASTYVVANYNVDSLSLDIVSDIPQILGRQRRKDNPFREIVHIFYKDNKRIVTDDEFRDSQQQKMEKSMKQISIWKTADVSCKTIALENIANLISSNPNEYYLTTTNGVPEINNLIMMSEMYCRDILRNHHQWFVMNSNNYGKTYSMPVQKLKDELCMANSKEEMLRVAYHYFTNYNPDLIPEYFTMFQNEGFKDVAYYYNLVSPERIKANGFAPSRIENEIANKNKENEIASLVVWEFTRGDVYSKKEVKEKLQGIYDRLGVKKTAKSTDLFNYIECSPTKKDGIKAIRIN